MPTLGDIVYSFSSFFTLQRSYKAAPRRSVNPVTSDYPPGGKYTNWQTWNEERQARLALYTGWSFSAIRKIGMASLASDLLVKQRVGENTEDIKNHPIELLIQSPNPDTSREMLWLDTIDSMYLKAAYWFLYPDQRGDIAEIWPMPFTRVSPVPDESPNPTRLFSSFMYTFKTGKELLIPPENVVYIRFPDPFDPYGSLPPLKAATRAIIADNSQSEWNTTLFDQNKGLPSSIIGVDTAQLDSGQFELLKRELKDNVGKRYLVPSGMVKVEFMQQTQEAMQFLESREFNKQEIYDIFGIPDNLSDKEAWRYFINQTVWPTLQVIGGQIGIQLIKPYFGPDIMCEFEDIRPQDRSLEVQESVQYSPFRSFNEERSTRNESPLKRVVIPEHIEAYAGMSLYDDIPSKLVDALLPLILKDKPEPIPAQLQGGFGGIPSMADSAGADHAQEQEESEAADNEDLAEETQPEEPEVTAKALPGGYIVPFETEQVKAAIVLSSWKDISIKKLARGKSAAHVYLYNFVPESQSYELATVLGHCRTEAAVKAVFNHLDDYTNLKAQLGTPIDAISQGQLDEEDKFIDPVAQWLETESIRIARATGPNGELPNDSFWDNEKKLLTAFLIPFVASWIESGISETVIRLNPTGLGVDAIVNARAAEWASQHALELAKNLTDTTRELAKAKIKQYLAAGTRDISALEASLAEVISPRWRASLIAQTEVTRAYSIATQKIAQELGVVKRLVWYTAQDERVCPICLPLNGKTRPVNSGTFPGGFDLPPAHPRCRCQALMET